MTEKQERWTPEQYQNHFSKKKGSEATAGRLKYGNHRVEIDGHKFDSKKEADYYGRLKILKKSGEVVAFIVHPEYIIQVNGIEICKYIADFSVAYKDGRIETVDIKSKATEGLAVFQLKRKLMKAVLGIEIKIV